MTAKKGMDFCIECRRNTEYILRKKNITKTRNDKDYIFSITTAVCTECGAEMSPPGLIDKNIREMEAQYCIAEGITSTENETGN